MTSYKLTFGLRGFVSMVALLTACGSQSAGSSDPALTASDTQDGTDDGAGSDTEGDAGSKTVRGNGGSGVDASSGGDAQGGGTTSAAYPAGPYGVAVGQTAADFTVQGYRSYDERDKLETISLHDLYNPDGSKPAKLLFVTGTEYWCGVCRRETAEMPKLAAMFQDEPAVALMNVTMGGAKPGLAPTQGHLDAWIKEFQLPFWTTIDTERATVKFFHTPHPSGYLIDLATMKVLYKLGAFTPATTIKAEIEKHLR